MSSLVARAVAPLAATKNNDRKMRVIISCGIDDWVAYANRICIRRATRMQQRLTPQGPGTYVSWVSSVLPSVIPGPGCCCPTFATGRSIGLLPTGHGLEAQATIHILNRSPKYNWRLIGSS